MGNVLALIMVGAFRGIHFLLYAFHILLFVLCMSQSSLKPLQFFKRFLLAPWLNKETVNIYSVPAKMLGRIQTWVSYSLYLKEFTVKCGRHINRYNTTGHYKCSSFCRAQKNGLSHHSHCSPFHKGPRKTSGQPLWGGKNQLQPNAQLKALPSAHH